MEGRGPSGPDGSPVPADQLPKFPAAVRHLTGLAAASTVAAGLGLVAGGVALLLQAAERPEGWVFLVLAGAACLAGGGVAASLPWRLTTVLDEEEIRLGWALGVRRVPWGAVRRVVIGPLGSGKERDPVTVTLLLVSGEELLHATLGRRRPEDHPAAVCLIEEARRRKIPVDDTLAPPEERRRREKEWREARIKGWR